MSQNYLNAPIEFKKLSAKGFSGYGSIFGNVDHGGDVVVKGAFQESLEDYKAKGRLPAMLWMHNPENVAGKYEDMYEDQSGLFVKGIFADTQVGRDTQTLVKMDAVSGLSIGYRATETDYDKSGARIIKQAELFEVSVVPMPMNDAARINLVKSYTNGSAREIEYVMRDAGTSRSFAKSVVHYVMDERDAVRSNDWLEEFRKETDSLQNEIIISSLRK
jgi:HK97 family phage prohead protease